MEIHNHDVKEQKSSFENKGFDPDKRVEVKETAPVTGGSYSEVKKNTDSSTHEVHHMPSDSSSNLERNDGPEIRMETKDHMQTASWGNSKEARAYRTEQKNLIDQGKFIEAVKMDIDDIKSKFNDKYDKEIDQMMKYVDKLEANKQI